MNDEIQMPAEARSRERAARASAQRRRVWWAVGIIALVAVAVSAAVALTGRKGEAGTRAAEAKPIPVRVTEAKRGDLALEAHYRGELDADVAELAAQATGYLIELDVSIGDEVKEGDTLGQIEPTQAERDIAEAQAQVLAALAAKKRNAAQLTLAETELERGKQALADQLISEKEATALQASVEVLRAESDAVQAQVLQAQARVASLRERLHDTRLLAPFDGAVAERYVDPGTVVQPGTAIVRLVRSGPLRVRFRVPERDLARMKPGMRIEIATQASEDERFEGEVARIGAEVSRLDRTAAVEGLLRSDHAALRPGMYAEVRITLGTLKNAVLIPSVAIVEQMRRDGEPQPGVFVVRDGHALWTAVKVRGASGDQTAVEGVSAGDALVTLGQNSLRDGAAVRLARDEQPQRGASPSEAAP